MIREFEFQVNSKVSHDVLVESYRKMEEYIHVLPCGCGTQGDAEQNFGLMRLVHSTLPELLRLPQAHLRMNTLDEKRRKKILLNLEFLQTWISKDLDFDENKRFETIKELTKMARALQQMAFDVSIVVTLVILSVCSHLN